MSLIMVSILCLPDVWCKSQLAVSAPVSHSHLPSKPSQCPAVLYPCLWQCLPYSMLLLLFSSVLARQRHFQRLPPPDLSGQALSSGLQNWVGTSP